MPSASDQVKDALGATSLLLVFVSVLFNAKYAEIRKWLATTLPDTGPKDVSVWRDEILHCLVSDLGPLLAVSGSATIIFIPVVKTILMTRGLAYWDNLDFAVTTFLFVFVAMAGLSTWAAYRMWQLWGKVRAADAELRRTSGQRV